MSLDIGMLDRAVRGHVEKHVGKIASIYHYPMYAALLGGGLPLEALHVPPSAKRPFHVLVSMGMSQEPLPAPSENESLRHVELTICLPDSWEPPQDAIVTNEVTATSWPIRHLFNIAQHFHKNRDFPAPGMLFPNGEGPGNLEPFAETVPFYGSLIWLPGQFGEGFLKLSYENNLQITFLSIICLKKSEVEALLPLDWRQLISRVSEGTLDELADPAREAVGI